MQQPVSEDASLKDEVLYFWAFGDLHFRVHEQRRALHAPRMACMFADVQQVWREEGKPAFCVAPGDIVDKGAAVHYELAKQELARQVGDIPLYPGIGNHEYQPDNDDDVVHTGAEFMAAWGKPIRYAWTAGPAQEVVCIMLDQPNPFLPGTRREHPHVIFSEETLRFLDTTLAAHAGRMAIIFAHCPLHNTVLDRDPKRNMDDDSLDPFFFVENSHEVRAILARHRNAVLYVSGNTHSGWGSPQLVFTEQMGGVGEVDGVGGHAVHHVNLMSPWYTGRFAGVRQGADGSSLVYRPDTPDVLVTFAFHVSADAILVRARDHQSQRWLAQWRLPL